MGDLLGKVRTEGINHSPNELLRNFRSYFVRIGQILQQLSVILYCGVQVLYRQFLVLWSGNDADLVDFQVLLDASEKILKKAQLALRLGRKIDV